MPDSATDAEDFHAELRGWLVANFTADVAAALQQWGTDEGFAAHRTWNATLVDAGYGAIAWPVEFGGRAAGILDQLVYNEEMARAGAPGPVNAIGVANIAPAIMTFGTDEQKERFLAPLLRGDEIWSQGMSEPEAGSDLASLRCRAVLDGDHFVINGQKTWNSNGDRADWCQLYVRTNTEVAKHKGITCLLVDMRTPGVEARPIVTMAGDTAFSELFFTDARVPVSAMLGSLDEGWTVATSTLSNERAGVASLYLSLRRKLDRLLEAASERAPDGTRPIDSPVVRDELMSRYIDTRNLEFLAKRSLGIALSGRPPGAEGSVIKLAWAKSEQAVAMTAVDVLGMAALSDSWGSGMLGSRSLSIAGGTTEVNRNIVGERVLGLPREPKPARLTFVSTIQIQGDTVQDVLQYEGKRVVVTGAASGMGEATATILTDLGAEVHGLDIKEGPAPVKAFHLCDLSDPDQIEATVAEIGGPVDSLFNSAGLPTTAPGQKIVAVNFLGHRHLTETMLPNITHGGSVGFISSAAGMGWQANVDRYLELLGTDGFAAGKAWCDAHDDLISSDGYSFSKEAINTYVAWHGYQTAATVRINGIMPGPTDTPMMPSFVEMMGEDFFAKFPKPVGRNSRPDEQAWALVMLNSPRSSYTVATNVFTDGGFSGGMATGSIDFAAIFEG